MRWLVVFSSLVTACLSVQPRIDCFPEPGVTQDLCTQRNCIWENSTESAKINAPPCFLPNNTGFTYDRYDNASSTYVLTKTASATNPANPYGGDFQSINVNMLAVGSTLNIRIGLSGRYEPPLSLPKKVATSSDQLVFQATDVGSIFSFSVSRARTGTNLWDTSIGGLMFSDQYIQIATLLPCNHIYGFGEHIHQTIMHDLTQYLTWPMLARDEAPDSGTKPSTRNLYSVHPFYMAMEEDGNSHGVLILNSNAQEVTLGPGPHLIYRTIGGMLDLYFFPGPTPGEVISQYLALIGTPFLPAYWALGFQLSRWGYMSLNDMKAAVNRTQAAKIPLDIPYADIDYMDKDKDFTEGWNGFDDYVKELNNQGLHVILIFDPAIEADYDSFNRSESFGVSYIDWPSHDFVSDQIENNYTMIKDKNIMLGNVWPSRNAAFPDFLDSTGATTKWWTNEFTNFHAKCPFDGIWIDMNEPSNFNTGVYNRSAGETPPLVNNFNLMCPIGQGYSLDDPPYSTWAVYLNSKKKEYLSTKTLCMIGVTNRNKSRFYDTKNLYGWAETKATDAALKSFKGNKRSAIISRSTFVSSGRYGGTWLGDNSARWDDMRTAVIGVMEYNMFGIPYVGSDICGFLLATEEELCLRWHQLGAFHPFSRNHNSIMMPAQDPAQWPSVAIAAREALTLRYKLLPYLYSLMFSANLYGQTVIRPVFFEFPNDPLTYEISNQFMWGSALLFAPVLTKGADARYVYFPNATWYSMRPTEYGQRIDGVGFKKVDAPLNWTIPFFIKGNTVVPTQAPGLTTTESRRNPFGLLIALDWANPSAKAAEGDLYWDDGETPNNYYKWHFIYSVTPTTATLTINVQNRASGLTLPSLDSIDIFGYGFDPDINSITINGQQPDIVAVSRDRTKRLLLINGSGFIDLTASDVTTLSWKHSDRTATTSATSATSKSTISSTISATTTTSSTSTTTIQLKTFSVLAVIFANVAYLVW